MEYCLVPFIKCADLCPAQFGYRSNTSTTLAGTLLTETIKSNIVGKSKVFTCFLDLSKAFERVNHNILIEKLYSKNVPDFIIGIFKYIFRNSTAQVNFNNEFGSKRKITSGVRQGGVTSAYLFNIYVDDILSYISNLSPGCRVGINKINIQAYADDMVLLSQSYKSLQFLIDKISELLTIRGLILNSDKTVIIVFHKNEIYSE